VLKTLYRRLRRTARCALGQDVRFPVQRPLPMVRHGSEYGGWWIWPEGLDSSSIVYSVGVGTDITFDVSIVSAYGLSVHAFDPTPQSVAFLEQQALPATLAWHPVGLAAYDGTATFHPPSHPDHVSHSMVSAVSMPLSLS
jgi:hypothetical protein